MTAPSSERYRDAARRLRPLFEQIADSAVERERERRLPYEEVRSLAAAGFGRLRLPVESGGDGLTIPEVAELLVDLAAADSNLPQIFRGHVAFVEDVLQREDSPARTAWLERLAGGDIVGNAWSETGSAVIGASGTVIERKGARLVVNGRKYYSTGSIFADWTDAAASYQGEEVTAIVRLDQPGVRIEDDWDGFGQRLTGTGTILFTDADVAESDVRPFSARFRYQTALYQLVLLAVQAGIAAAVERDTGAAVRERQRVYSHGLAPLAKDDAQIQAVAGEISAIAFTARALVREVAAAVQRAAETAAAPGSAEDLEANTLAEIRSAQAQVVLTDQVPRAATLLFNALGASGTSSAKALDRHWRNARTVGSHNPVVYKQRIVGDWSINGTVPPFAWQVGVAKDGSAPA